MTREEYIEKNDRIVKEATLSVVKEISDLVESTEDIYTEYSFTGKFNISSVMDVLEMCKRKYPFLDFRIVNDSDHQNLGLKWKLIKE